MGPLAWPWVSLMRTKPSKQCQISKIPLSMSELQLMVPAYSWYSQQIKNCDEQAQLAPCFTKRWPSQPCNVYLKSHDMAQGATNAKEIAEKGKVTCRKKKTRAYKATSHSNGPKSHLSQPWPKEPPVSSLLFQRNHCHESCSWYCFCFVRTKMFQNSVRSSVAKEA